MSDNMEVTLWLVAWLFIGLYVNARSKRRWR